MSVIEDHLTGASVLIVDDDGWNIFALLSYLEASGLNVMSAESGAEALDLIVRWRPQIILMDIMMPKMDGFETIAHIRSMPSVAEVPIIAVTARAMKGDRERCLGAGASDYVSKPVNMQELLNKMAELLKNNDGSY
ncbi:MAG TPA: response regulator [Sphingobacteriaceae bacterium]